MGLGDKFEHKAQEVKGQAKASAGDATDNERLQTEGRTEKSGANLKQAGEKVKDVFKK